MRRVTAVLSAAAVVLLTAGLFAQAKPNFAGKWVLEPAADAAGGGGGRGRGFGRGGLGQELTITQDAKTLTLEYTAGGQNPQPVKLVYNLDGTESKNSMMGRGGQAQEQVSKAVWEGNKLVVTTTVDFGGNSFETKRAFSLDGANLKIENTNPGFGGNGPTTTTQTYKKAS